MQRPPESFPGQCRKGLSLSCARQLLVERCCSQLPSWRIESGGFGIDASMRAAGGAAVSLLPINQF